MSQGSESRRRAQYKAEETDPGQWWVPEKIDCCRAGVARRKGHGRNGVAPRTQKRQMFRRRRQAHLECDKKIRNRDLRQQLRFGSTRTSGGIYRKAVGHHEASRIFRQGAENERQDIVEGSAPSEREKEITHRIGAGNVGAPATLGSFPLVTREAGWRR
jgi:hypothetical protein